MKNRNYIEKSTKLQISVRSKLCVKDHRAGMFLLWKFPDWQLFGVVHRNLTF